MDYLLERLATNRLVFLIAVFSDFLEIGAYILLWLVDWRAALGVYLLVWALKARTVVDNG